MSKCSHEDLIAYLERKKVPSEILLQLREKKIGSEQLAHLSFDTLTKYLGFSDTNAAILVGFKEDGELYPGSEGMYRLFTN